jgi:hypothetical protein
MKTTADCGLRTTDQLQTATVICKRRRAVTSPQSAVRRPQLFSV